MPVPNDPAAGDFNHELLNTLGLPVSQANLLFLNLWEQAEGGHSVGAAHWNPLNTKMQAPGAVARSNGVMDYPSQDIGVWATAQTLRLPAYAPILSAMRASDIKASAEAVVKSPWGTLPHPLLDLVGDSEGNAIPEDLATSTALVAGQVTGVIPGAHKLLGWMDALAAVLNNLLSAKFWLRIGQGLVAGILLLIALGLIFRKQIARAGAAAATDGLSEAI